MCLQPKSGAESPVKQALLEIRRLKARLAEAENANRDPIAIVGIGLRLPGGIGTPDALWEKLSQGFDAVRTIPASRWRLEDYYDENPDAPGKAYSRHGAFIEDAALFDADFFGISPREAQTMDPQQRVLMEVAWEALEHAGIAPELLWGSAAGIYLGIASDDYGRRLFSAREQIDPYFATGNAFSVAGGRLSYFLSLKGPCVSIDTACSASLVAVHLACQSLRLGESDLALAGGVNLILSPDLHINFCKSQMLSKSGRCHTFDKDADGYVRGEGCGIVVLKPLSKALSDGNIVEPPEASSPTALPWERAGWRSCGPTGMVHLGDGFVGAIFAGGEGLALHEILNMLGNSSSLAWRVEPEFIWISSPEMMLCDSYGVATDEPEIRCGLPTVYGGTCLGRGAGAPHAALSVTIPATGECISISPVYPRDDIIAGPYYMHVLDVYSEGSDLVVLLKRLKTGRVIRVTSPLPGSEGEAADKESFKEGIGPREGIETTAGKAEAVEAQEIRAKETAGLRLIRIRVMPDGTSRAQVGFASGAYNWYREKDRFERYQLLHIEPEKACIQIKDETTGETFTLTCEEQRGQDRGTHPPALR